MNDENRQTTETLGDSSDPVVLEILSEIDPDTVASIGIVVVSKDGTAFTAYHVGSGSVADLVFGNCELHRRLMADDADIIELDLGDE